MPYVNNYAISLADKEKSNRSTPSRTFGSRLSAFKKNVLTFQVKARRLFLKARSVSDRSIYPLYTFIYIGSPSFQIGTGLSPLFSIYPQIVKNRSKEYFLDLPPTHCILSCRMNQAHQRIQIFSQRQRASHFTGRTKLTKESNFSLNAMKLRTSPDEPNSPETTSLKNGRNALIFPFYYLHNSLKMSNFKE